MPAAELNKQQFWHFRMYLTTSLFGMVSTAPQDFSEDERWSIRGESVLSAYSKG